jgi:hypothetical protein
VAFEVQWSVRFKVVTRLGSVRLLRRKPIKTQATSSQFGDQKTQHLLVDMYDTTDYPRTQTRQYISTIRTIGYEVIYIYITRRVALLHIQRLRDVNIRLILQKTEIDRITSGQIDLPPDKTSYGGAQQEN